MRVGRSEPRLPVFGQTFPAINRTVSRWFERNFAFFLAIRTGDFCHFSGRSEISRSSWFEICHVNPRTILLLPNRILAVPEYIYYADSHTRESIGSEFTFWKWNLSLRSSRDLCLSESVLFSRRPKESPWPINQ